MIIPIKLCGKQTEPPLRAHEGDAGYDLTSLENFDLNPLERRLVKTGVRVAIPINHYGRVAPRSGLALEFGVDVLGGVIDSSYRGEIGVILVNLSNDIVSFDEGEKIAQLIIEKCQPVEWLKTDDLSSSERGDSGYGSSDSGASSLSNSREVDLSNSLGTPRASEDD